MQPSGSETLNQTHLHSDLSPWRSLVPSTHHCCWNYDVQSYEIAMSVGQKRPDFIWFDLIKYRAACQLPRMLLLPLDLTLKLRPPPYISRTLSLRLNMSHEAPWSSCKETPAGYSPNMLRHTNTLRLNPSPPPPFILLHSHTAG